MKIKITLNKFKIKHHKKNLNTLFLEEFRKFLILEIVDLTTISPHTLVGEVGTRYDKKRYFGKLSAVKNRYFFRGEFQSEDFTESVYFDFDYKNNIIKLIDRHYIVEEKKSTNDDYLDENLISNPNSDQVAERALALLCVSSAAMEYPEGYKQIKKWISDEKMKYIFSESEEKFFSMDPSEKLIIRMSWRIEAFAVLMWALQKINSLPQAIDNISWDETGLPPDMISNYKSFIKSSKLRSEDELYQMQEKIESQHWALRAGPSGRKLFGHSEEGNLSIGIIYERHYAINWLTGYNEDWDLIQTDT